MTKYQPVRHKRWMLVAFLIFLLETIGIIARNSALGYGWHVDYSISRYVGLETWSAVIFGIGNLGVAILMLLYLYGVGESWRLGKWFFIIAVVMSVALLGLSAFPLGYFDPEGAEFASSTISHLHQVFSRSMFALMLALAVVSACLKCVDDRTRIFAYCFITYGAVCVLGFLTQAAWFLRFMLFFESAYVLSFMVWCLFCQTKRKLIQKGVKNGSEKN